MPDTNRIRLDFNCFDLIKLFRSDLILCHYNHKYISTFYHEMQSRNFLCSVLDENMLFVTSAWMMSWTGVSYTHLIVLGVINCLVLISNFLQLFNNDTTVFYVLRSIIHSA